MQSNDASSVYREVAHGISGSPAQLRVRVMLRAAAGVNQGMIFTSIGAAEFDDETAPWARHGGVISAFDGTSVRLWAPYFTKYVPARALVNAFFGLRITLLSAGTSVGP